VAPNPRQTTVPAVPGIVITDVSPAGSVRWEIEGNMRLRLLSVTTNAGWSASTEEAEGSELRVRFRSDAGAALEFEAERQDRAVVVTTAPGGD
jgi:hypothetical protein